VLRREREGLVERVRLGGAPARDEVHRGVRSAVKTTWWPDGHSV
jgi:hypothetical protein